MYAESPQESAVPAIFTGFMLLLICLVIVVVVIAAPKYIEMKQYDSTCREFADHFDAMPAKTCVAYLKENPDATGQDVLDHQADLLAIEREMLLAERLAPPAGNDSCQHFDSRHGSC